MTVALVLALLVGVVNLAGLLMLLSAIYSLTLTTETLSAQLDSIDVVRAALRGQKKEDRP